MFYILFIIYYSIVVQMVDGRYFCVYVHDEKSIKRSKIFPILLLVSSYLCISSLSIHNAFNCMLLCFLVLIELKCCAHILQIWYTNPPYIYKNNGSINFRLVLDISINSIFLYSKYWKYIQSTNNVFIDGYGLVRSLPLCVCWLRFYTLWNSINEPKYSVR